MTKIIIGKQGDQKFPIKNAGVSRQHASITIEGGHWILEDLDSTNGTFVRDDNGLYQRVSRVEIKEDTMVRLGDESSNGYAVSYMPFLSEQPRLQLMVMRIGMLLPPVYIFFASGKNKMQRIYDRQQRILVCPRCGRPLTDYEITKQMCMTCKAHS